MLSATPPSFDKAPLFLLALGTFAIGTESFMISPLLPGLAADFSVSIAAAGQLVTAFALTYALSSPILTTLTGSVDRRKLLIGAMVAFAIANFIAVAATGYWTLMGARILLAAAAGLYVPSANALASGLVAPERRGSALAIVNGGTTIAITLGVPLGAIIGHSFGWRMTFAGVGLLATLAIIGLMTGLRHGVGARLPISSLADRIAVIQQPAILLGLLVTTLWAMGAYTIYTYLAPYLSLATGIEGAHVGPVLFLWGIAAAAGLFLGGGLNDKFGARAVMTPSLVLAALTFVSLSFSAAFLSPASALAPVLAAIVVWGVAVWAFFPSQQARLIGIAGMKVAPVALSLNASFMYLGFSLGAALGSLTLSAGSVIDLGWVGGLCEIAALLLVLGTTHNAAARVAPLSAEGKVL